MLLLDITSSTLLIDTWHKEFLLYTVQAFLGPKVFSKLDMIHKLVQPNFCRTDFHQMPKMNKDTLCDHVSDVLILEVSSTSLYQFYVLYPMIKMRCILGNIVDVMVYYPLNRIFC